MNKKINWIGEVEAAELAGLEAPTFRRYVVEGKLAIRYSKLTRKAKPKYAKEDIETLIEQNMKPVSNK